jgi:hypothetical protein
VGAGGRFTGLGIGLVGIGVGGDATGIMIGGVGVGSGGTLKGLAVSGVGTGAPKIVGIVLSALAAGSEDIRGAVVAPAYVRVEDGRLSGASLSAFNHIKGDQHGLTIGIINYARRLDGVQIGVLNYAGNNRRAKLLPIANVHIE